MKNSNIELKSFSNNILTKNSYTKIRFSDIVDNHLFTEDISTNLLLSKI